jgi:hypothetical protein
MKIKSKVICKTINNKDILDTFQELLGTSDSNACLPIAYPKYLKMKNHIQRFLKLMQTLRENNLMNYFEDIKTSLNNYITSLEKDFSESFNSPDLEQYCDPMQDTLAGHNYGNVPPNIKSTFSEIFNDMKKCNIVNIIIVTCNNLLPYRKHFENKDNLSELFLTKTAGNIVNPVAELPELNFKKIYNEDSLSASEKSFILMFIAKLYEISFNVYETLSSPDVDVNEFVAIILNSIDTVKKHIPRCNDAFDKIVESVDILKTNFTGYYKDFMASSNPAIIMENFVLDVSKNTKASPRVTAQFRKIITYYRNIASKHVTDPKLQTLFKHVDKNFEALDKYQKDDDTYEDIDENAEDSDDSSETNNEHVPETNNENVPETNQV